MSHFIVGNYFCGLFDDVHALHIFVLAHLLKESIHFFYDPKKSKATFLYICSKLVISLKNKNVSMYLEDKKGGHRLIIAL